MYTFDQLPTAVEKLQNEQTEIKEMLAILLNQKKEAEKPINSNELMRLLGVSHVTLINLRKRNDIPFFLVRGNCRYLYSEVIAALNNRKK